MATYAQPPILNPIWPSLSWGASSSGRARRTQSLIVSSKPLPVMTRASEKISTKQLLNPEGIGGRTLRDADFSEESMPRTIPLRLGRLS